MSVLAYFPAYYDRKPHGGIRRSNQIRDLCLTGDGLEIRLRNAPMAQPYPASGILSLGPRVSRFLKRTIYCTARGRDRNCLYERYVDQQMKNLEFSVAAVEFSLDIEKNVPLMMRRRRIPYVLFLHNVEFLVPREQYHPNSGIDYELERDAMRHALHCVTISESDARIARIFSRSVSVLPYYPSAKDCDRFDSIRTARRKRGPDMLPASVAVMGTVANWPTLVGMRELANWLGQASDDGADVEFRIVGYNTERYFSDCGRCRVLGSVSDAELDRVLVASTSVVIHQAPTSGFLTRLVELNLAGVPVAVNDDYEQARGLEAWGIYTYRSFSDLGALIARLANLGEFDRFEPPTPECLSGIRELLCRHSA